MSLVRNKKQKQSRNKKTQQTAGQPSNVTPVQNETLLEFYQHNLKNQVGDGGWKTDSFDNVTVEGTVEITTKEGLSNEYPYNEPVKFTVERDKEQYDVHIIRDLSPSYTKFFDSIEFLEDFLNDISHDIHNMTDNPVYDTYGTEPFGEFTTKGFFIYNKTFPDIKDYEEPSSSSSVKAPH